MTDALRLRDATVQDIQLELIRRTTFNALDGERVCASLLKHRQLWTAVLLDRPGLANYAKPSHLLSMLILLPHPNWMRILGVLLPIPASLLVGKLVSMLLPSPTPAATP